MKITKYLREEEKQKKTKTKSFRLTEKALYTLETLAKISGNSQNDITNEMLEDYFKELNFSEFLKDYLSVLTANGKIKIGKSIRFELEEIFHYYEITILNEGTNIFLCKYIMESFNTQNGRKKIFETIFHFTKIVELLESGVDSSCSMELIKEI